MHQDLMHLLHALPEPSMLLRGDGSIIAANQAAVELANAPPDRLVGRTLASLVVDAAAVADYLRLCSRSRDPVPGMLHWLRGNEPSVELRCDGSVISPRTATEPSTIFLRCRRRNEEQDPFILLTQKVAALSNEILERKKLEQQRDELLQAERAARLEAEQHGRLKDEFLATLSHELRTPLSAILGWAHLLRDSSTDPAMLSEGLAVIERNANLQRQLIEDLLDMSRIISGKVRMDVQRVEPAAVIEAAVRSIQPAAEARGIRVQVTLDPLAGPVKGDPARLQQIVWNLLSNAVKFTPKGGRVQVFLERVNSHIELTVSDTGEGIRLEFLPHVFERFRQADSSTTRRHGGLGLGLSIVKQLTELHGGSVRAKSPGPGQGSSFVVALPLLVLHDEAAPTAPLVAATHSASGAAGPTLSLSGVTVVVVDDEPDARDLVKRLLERTGATVATAASAEEAMPLIAGRPPDLIVSDIGMPGADGFEFIRRVRTLAADAGGKTPAIALSAFVRTEDRVRAMHAGFNIHLSKPIDAPELIAAAASLTGHLESRPDSTGPALRPATAGGETAGG